MSRKITCIILFCMISFLFVLHVSAFELPKWFPFNQENSLKEWQEKIFKDRVLYVVETNKDDGYLRARSRNACSGLIYKISFNAQELPYISWKWKVEAFPEKGNKYGREGGWLEKDDYAARVYVIFPSFNIFRIKTLEYIWDESLPAGTIMSSPYSDNIRLVVVESGKDHSGSWVFEERNIAEDYVKAFGKKRVPRVGAIAIMTDSDNTLSTSEAFYKDIRVGYKK